MDEITSQLANHYLTYLVDEQGVQAHTVMNQWVMLSAFWTWASDELKIPNVIKERVPRPKVKKKALVPFTKEEVKAIERGLRYMKSYDQVNDKYVEVERTMYIRDAAMMAVLLDTGIRVVELCALNVADFNKQNGQLIALRGKGDKQRTLPMGDRAQRQLWQYLTKRGGFEETDPLFVTRDGKRLDRNLLRQIVANGGKRAGVKKVGPHRFRHTFAINFLRNGGSPLELQRMLGHKNLEMVLGYVQLVDVDIESAQKRAGVGDAWKI